jgi:hypothetical protein
MTGKERIIAKLRGVPRDSQPVMPIMTMLAVDLAAVPRGRPHANLEAIARFACSRS